MTPKTRKLLVLDLDETLIHATEDKLDHDEDFRVGPYRVHLRPHLPDFVKSVLAEFRVGVWTASGESYAAQVVERIFPSGTLEFVWSSARCTTTRNWTTGEYQSSRTCRN